MIEIVSCNAVQYGSVEIRTIQCGKQNGFGVSSDVEVDDDVAIVGAGLNIIEPERFRIPVELVVVEVVFDNDKLF